MDISVSRLNQRMALQLPAELPLGLVFVVGEVQLPKTAQGSSGNGRLTEFHLGDDGYRLPCRLSERAATEFRLEDGDMVRAGGHLVFEAALASYYLLARDIERLDGFRPAARPLAAIIADSNRREAAASVTRAELPPWVQQMAPPEVRSPQVEGALETGMTMNGPELGDWELLVDAESAMAQPEAEPALAGLSDELIAFLSQAMDSEVEVEITSEILTDLNNTGTTDRLSPDILEALDLFEASVTQEASERQRSSVQEVQPPESVASQDLSPLEIYLTWAEQSIEESDAASEPAAEGTITAAEVAMAMESAGSSATAGPAAQESPRSEAPVAGNGQVQARKAKPNDTIPWYFALLIIIVVLIIVVAFVYVLLFADNLPAAFSLDLLEELPLGN